MERENVSEGLESAFTLHLLIITAIGSQDCQEVR